MSRNVSMSRTARVLACGAAFACLCGCASAGAYGRELEETVLVQVIGVDRTEEGVALTAAGTDGEGKWVMERVEASGLEEAFAALPTAGEQYYALTNVTQLLIGDGMDVRTVLWYVMDDRDMSYTAKVWAVNGFAGAVMERAGEDGMERFKVLEQSGTREETVKSALAALLSEGEAALPALAVREERLEPVGTVFVGVAGA